MSAGEPAQSCAGFNVRLQTSEKGVGPNKRSGPPCRSHLHPDGKPLEDLPGYAWLELIKEIHADVRTVDRIPVDDSGGLTGGRREAVRLIFFRNIPDIDPRFRR